MNEMNEGNEPMIDGLKWVAQGNIEMKGTVGGNDGNMGKMPSGELAESR
jgi:hypothetical protein